MAYSVETLNRRCRGTAGRHIAGEWQQDPQHPPPGASLDPRSRSRGCLQRGVQSNGGNALTRRTGGAEAHFGQLLACVQAALQGRNTRVLLAQRINHLMQTK